MPLLDWNLKETWDAAYIKNAEPDGHPNTRPAVKLHYHRGIRTVRIAERAAALGFRLGPAQFNSRILIVGGGFGWTAEEMLAQDFLGPIVVADTSTYIHAEKDNDDEAEIRTHIAETGLDPDSVEGQAIITRTKTTGPRRGTITILDEDVLTNEGRRAIRQVLGNPQIVITESVMESLTDAECLDLHAACESFPGNPNILHLVYPTFGDGSSQDPTYNWKTLAEWLALIPSAIWVDLRTYDVVGI